jgi:hypothetical protein
MRQPKIRVIRGLKNFVDSFHLRIKNSCNASAENS